MYPGAATDRAGAEYYLGNALHAVGNSQAALVYLQSSHKYFESVNDAHRASIALIKTADCLVELGRYDEADEVYTKTIAISQQRNDPRSRAVARGQLATLRNLQGAYEEVISLFSDVLNTFKNLGEPAMVAVSWHQLGNVYKNAGLLEKSEDAYQNSLHIKFQMADRAAQAATLGSLGNLYSATRRPEDATRLNRQAAEIFMESKDLRSEGTARTNAAIYLTELGRYNEARAEIERAIECKKPFGHTAEPWKTFDILCDIERVIGNQDAALAAREQAGKAYLAYRRDGGAPQIDTSELTAAVERDLSAARDALNDTTLSYMVAAEIVLALARAPS